MPVGEDGDFVDPVAFRKHLRKHRTPAEEILWEHLSQKQTGFRFTQQYKINGAYVDLCCRSHQVVIELDGSSHEHKREEDQERDQRLVENGYMVLRFSNQEVIDHIDKVLAKIISVCETRPQWRY